MYQVVSGDIQGSPAKRRYFLKKYFDTLAIKMFGPGAYSTYVPEGGRVATSTRFLIFDSYDIKSLWGKFGYDNFTGFKMASPQSWDACFSVILWIEIEDL